MKVGTARLKAEKRAAAAEGCKTRRRPSARPRLRPVCCPNLAPGAIARVHGRDTALPRDRKQVTPSVGFTTIAPSVAVPSLPYEATRGSCRTAEAYCPSDPSPNHPNSRDDPGGYSSGNARYPLQRLRLTGAATLRSPRPLILASSAGCLDPALYTQARRAPFALAHMSIAIPESHAVLQRFAAAARGAWGALTWTTRAGHTGPRAALRAAT